MRNRLTLVHLIRREMRRTRLNTALCLAVMVIATSIFVAIVAISRTSVDATRIMMKQMGFNLLITPQGVDPVRYQALDFQDVDMPEEYVTRLAKGTVLAQHFVAKYQKSIPVEGCTAVLTGVLAEVCRQNTQKRPMPTAYDVPRGQVYVGLALARALELEEGDTLTLLNHPFTVKQVLPESAVIPEDIRIYAHLHDVQMLVGRPGRINAIDALACACPVAVKDVIAALEQSVQRVLPDVQVQPYHSILLARHRQRTMMVRLQSIALIIVLAGSVTAIWGLTYQNVRNRLREIGVFRALGIPAWRIGALFVGKILAYGIAGSLLGCLLGMVLAGWVNIEQSEVSTPYALFVWVLLVAPVMAVVSGLPPVVSGLLHDPTDTLRNAET